MLVPDLYGEVVGWLDDAVRSEVVCYLASVAGLKDDWGVSMSLAFNGGYKMGRFLDVWERSGEESREYLMRALKRRNDVDFEGLMEECCKRGVTEIFKWLIDNGVGYQEHLHWAAENGHVDVMRMLLRAGANVNAYDDYAFRYAARMGHIEVVRMLLGVGANVHAKDDYALRWAIENGHVEVVRMLLEVGANVHVKDDWALRRATENGHVEAVRMLLGVGANVHANDDHVLRCAVRNCHVEMMRVFLRVGADVHADTIRFDVEKGHGEVVRLLSVCKN